MRVVPPQALKVNAEPSHAGDVSNWCAAGCRRAKQRHRRVETHRSHQQARAGAVQLPGRQNGATAPLERRRGQPGSDFVQAGVPKVQASLPSLLMEFIVRPVGTGSTTGPSGSLASHARRRPALWAAVAFGFAGLYLSARGRGAARVGDGRCYGAASLSTLMWCLVLGASYVAAPPVLLRSLGRPGHSAAMSHVAVERVALLLMAAVIVGGAALVELPSSPSGRGRRPPRA